MPHVPPQSRRLSPHASLDRVQEVVTSCLSLFLSFMLIIPTDFGWTDIHLGKQKEEMSISRANALDFEKKLLYIFLRVVGTQSYTESLSHLVTLLPKSSSQPLPAQPPNHAT